MQMRCRVRPTSDEPPWLPAFVIEFGDGCAIDCCCCGDEEEALSFFSLLLLLLLLLLPLLLLLLVFPRGMI
jgi:hypothetical protein